MLRKVKKNAHDEIVLATAESLHGMRICGKVNPANDSAEYINRFDITGYPFRCLYDYVAKYHDVISIKKGNEGQVVQYDHIHSPEWVVVNFKLDDGTTVRGLVPITRLAISTTHILEDWLSYCKQDSYRKQHSLSPHSTEVTGPADCNPRVFTRVSVADQMDVYFRGLSTVTQIETGDAVDPTGSEFRTKRKLYYSKRSDRHSDDKHDLVLTTSADVGPPLGTQGYFLVEVMRWRKPHPYRYCTTGKLWIWSMEPYAKAVAFAFLYETEDGWKKMYFRGKEIQLLDGEVRRSFGYIFIAFSFLMFLQRVRIPRRWRHLTCLPDYGIADIWVLSVGELNVDQVYTAARQTGTGRFNNSDPHTLPRAEFHRYLNSLGCQMIVDPQDTVGMTRGWRSRKSCNLSQIKLVLESLAAGYDEHVEAGEEAGHMTLDTSRRRPCELCIMMGHDCAFERDIRLFTKKKATSKMTYAEYLIRDLAPLHWHPDFEPNPIVDATSLELALQNQRDV